MTGGVVFHGISVAGDYRNYRNPNMTPEKAGESVRRQP